MIAEPENLQAVFDGTFAALRHAREAFTRN